MTPEPDPEPDPDPPTPSTDATVTLTQGGLRTLTATMRAGDSLDSIQVWSTTGTGETFNMVSGSGYYLFVAHQGSYVPKSMKVNNVSVSGTQVTNGTVTWTRYNTVINAGSNTIQFSVQSD